MSKNRLLWPDIAKGIGILTVVFYHTTIPKFQQEYPAYYFIHICMGVFQMPLFFFVSGWLFQMKSKSYCDNKPKVKYSLFRYMPKCFFTLNFIGKKKRKTNYVPLGSPKIAVLYYFT